MLESRCTDSKAWPQGECQQRRAISAQAGEADDSSLQIAKLRPKSPNMAKKTFFEFENENFYNGI